MTDPMNGAMTDPERTALLMLIKNLVQQGCREKSGAYDSGFIGIYAEAMDILVNYGAAEYTGDYEQPFYGRGRSVRFTDKLRDIWDVIRDANQSAERRHPLYQLDTTTGEVRVLDDEASRRAGVLRGVEIARTAVKLEWHSCDSATIDWSDVDRAVRKEVGE